jgi:hypothetical protein
MTASQSLLDLFGGGEYVRDVGFLGFAQRSRDADDDRVTLAEMTEIRGRAQSLRVDHFLHFARGTSPM